jgi:hypothetical protein
MLALADSGLLAQQLDGRCLVIAPPHLLDPNKRGSWPNVFGDFPSQTDRFCLIDSVLKTEQNCGLDRGVQRDAQYQSEYRGLVDQRCNLSGRPVHSGRQLQRKEYSAVNFTHHSGLQSCLSLPHGGNSYMKMRTLLARRSLEILSLAATAVLLGCVGVSSTTTDPTGTGASTHTVHLSWNASTSADISGYNIYRAVYTNSCGTFSRISSVPITNTQYADSDVTGGTSYCYATTAVNASNEESGYSNIVSDVQIPAP